MRSYDAVASLTFTSFLTHGISGFQHPPESRYSLYCSATPRVVHPLLFGHTPCCAPFTVRPHPVSCTLYCSATPRVVHPLLFGHTPCRAPLYCSATPRVVQRFTVRPHPASCTLYCSATPCVVHPLLFGHTPCRAVSPDVHVHSPRAE